MRKNFFAIVVQLFLCKKLDFVIVVQLLLRKVKKYLCCHSCTTLAQKNILVSKINFLQAILMLFLVSLMYALCWLPLNVLNVLWTRCVTYLFHPYILFIWWGAHFSAMSHSCMNPFIYVATSQRFREGFAFVFRFIPGVNYQPKELLRAFETYIDRSRRDSTINDRNAVTASLIPSA